MGSLSDACSSPLDEFTGALATHQMHFNIPPQNSSWIFADHEHVIHITRRALRQRVVSLRGAAKCQLINELSRCGQRKAPPLSTTTVVHKTARHNVSYYIAINCVVASGPTCAVKRSRAEVGGHVCGTRDGTTCGCMAFLSRVAEMIILLCVCWVCAALPLRPMSHHVDHLSFFSAVVYFF